MSIEPPSDRDSLLLNVDNPPQPGASATGVDPKEGDADGTDGTDGDGTDGTDSDGADGTDGDGSDGADSDGTDGAD